MRFLSFLVLLIPAAYTWWHGRRLLRRLDDPQFAELHVRKASHLGTVIGVCMAASLLLSFELTGLKLLLAFLGMTAGDYRYHRTIFDESWGFFAYLGHHLRLTVALVGAWILIALLPELARAAGGAWLVAAAALALAIALASQLYSRLLKWFLGARAISHPELESRFAQILAKSGCRTPWIGRAGPAGGFWMNALAVPSFYRQGVVLTNDLLMSLGPRETTAIFAHEVGHLEQFTRKRLIVGELVLWTFVAVPLALAAWLGPASKPFGIFAGVWPFAVLLWFGLSASRSRKHEHEGDLRALALCGDARALIDGLTKVHLLGRLPRRWEAGQEAQMTHPSLAQRLRAIREAAGIAEPEIAELAIRAADGGDRAVVLAPDRLFWLAGVPPAAAGADPAALRAGAADRRSILYTDLNDLRLAAGGLKTRQLVATDRQGTSMKIPVGLEDVPAVKAALARVDARLAGTARGLSRATAAASTSSGWVRLDAVLLMILGLWSPSSGTLSLASLLVLIRPAQANLAAAGTLAVASALLGLAALEPPVFEDGATLLRLAAWTWFGIFFLWLAGRRYRARLEEPAWTLWTGLGALGGFALLSFGLGLGGLFRPLPAMQVHLWARAIPAAVLLSLGLAAMLLTVRRWPARAAATAFLIMPVAVAAVATPWFRDRFGGDPFAVGPPELTAASWQLDKTRELTVDDYVFQLVLSPSGERLAYSGEYGDSEDEYGGRSAFQVERADGSFVAVEATALEFLDDDRLVTLAAADDEVTLEIIDLSVPAGEETEPRVEIALPPILGPKLRVDAAIDRWQVVGHGEDGDGLVHLTGTLAGTLTHSERYPLQEGELWIGGQTSVDTEGRLLTASQDFGFGDSAGGFWLGMMLNFLSGATTTTEIAALETSGRRVLAETTLSAQCFDPAYGQAVFPCVATDARMLPWSLDDDGATHLWTIDPVSGRPSPVGSLADSYYEARVAADGRILLTAYGSAPKIVDPGTATAASLGETLAAEPALRAVLREVLEDLADVGLEQADLQSPEDVMFENVSPTFAFRSGLLGVAVTDDDGSTILVYRLPR